MPTTPDTRYSAALESVVGASLSFEEYCRRVIFTVCVSVSVLIMVIFGVYHVVVDSMVEGVVDLAVACYMIAVLAGLKHRAEGETLSHSVGIVVGALFIYLGTQGSEHGYRILWIYTYPAIMMMIYGRHIAMAYISVVFVAWSVLLLAPQSLTGAAAYGTGLTLRFMASFAIVTFVAWFSETIRAHYQLQMQRRTRQLENDRYRLLEAESRMRKLAHEDALTGISNRRRVLDDLSIAVAQRPTGGRYLGVALIDVDHFKQINDTYGHQAGDQVLAGLAQRIERIVRRTDQLGRYGGEEFLLVLNDVTEVEAVSVLELIRTAVEHSPFYAGAQAIDVTVSVGLALGLGSECEDDLILAADKAVYTAKERGRNRVFLAPVPTPQPKSVLSLVRQAS
ncbi:MAG: GGDEF domain-containing protein [Gammaproteobacteria bacterium]